MVNTDVVDFGAPFGEGRHVDAPCAGEETVGSGGAFGMERDLLYMRNKKREEKDGMECQR